MIATLPGAVDFIIPQKTVLILISSLLLDGKFEMRTRTGRILAVTSNNATPH